MTNPKPILIIIVIIVTVFVIFQFVNHRPTTVKNHISQLTPTPTISQTPTASPTASILYSDAVKTKVRSSFIDSCHTLGHYATAVCTCAADYLSKNYSESKLAEFFIQYHTSNQVPAAIKTSISACSVKK